MVLFAICSECDFFSSMNEHDLCFLQLTLWFVCVLSWEKEKGYSLIKPFYNIKQFCFKIFEVD